MSAARRAHTKAERSVAQLAGNWAEPKAKRLAAERAARSVGQLAAVMELLLAAVTVGTSVLKTADSTADALVARSVVLSAEQ